MRDDKEAPVGGVIFFLAMCVLSYFFVTNVIHTAQRLDRIEGILKLEPLERPK